MIVVILEMITIIVIAQMTTIDYVAGKTTIVIIDIMLIRRPSELGAIIAAARRARALTQGDLAKRLGVSRVWLGQIERGKASARIDLVFRLLNELDVTLTTGIGDQQPAGTAEASSRSDFDIDAIADTGLAKGTQPSPTPAVKKRRRT